MTIPSNVLRNKYEGNSLQTAFPYQFKIEDKTQLTASKIVGDDVFPLVVDVDFTVTGVGNDAGGNVIYPVSGPLLADNEFILIKPNVPYNQLMKLENQNTFPPKTVEKAMDYLCLQIKQLAEALERSIKVSDAYTENPDAFFATIADAANQAAAAAASATAALNSANNSQASAVAAAASAADAAATLAGALPKAGGDMAGVLGVANGTAANPSVAFADDKNTGMYSRVDEEINFSISGSERARIDQYGVSVGGIAPNFNGANGQVLHTHNPTAGGYSGLRITNSESGSGVSDGGFFAAVASEFFAWVYENMPLVFATNSVRRMEIKGDGTITTGNGTTVAAGYTAAGDITLPATGKIRALNTAKAWVNFNGSGTVAIRDSFNVTSITDNGVGDYTVNFTNAMGNANYSYFGGGNKTSGGAVVCIVGLDTVAPTTSALRVQALLSSTLAANDAQWINVIVFGQ